VPLRAAHALPAAALFPGWIRANAAVELLGRHAGQSWEAVMSMPDWLRRDLVVRAVQREKQAQELSRTNPLAALMLLGR